MDAWIDCMSSGLSNDDQMTRFDLKKDERLFIEVANTENFNLRLPEIFDALVECSAFVNNRYLEGSDIPKLALLFL